MNNSIFDLLPNEISEGKEGYFDITKNAPQPQDKSFLNDVSDYAKTFLKGSIEGVTQLGRMMGPLIDKQGRSTKEILDEQTEVLNQLIPTQEKFNQSALRRGLKQAPSALAFPGSSLATLPRAIAAGFLGEGAKELGAPEWAQTAAELTAYIGPDIMKKLLEKGSNKEIIAAGKELGMSDEAITPLIQSDFKQKWLSKLTPRRGMTESALKKSKSELGKTHQAIRQSPEAKNVLNSETSEKMIKDINEKLFEMPSGVRDKISTDFKDLLSKEISGDTLMNFWADINHEMGTNSKQLSLLKEPIREALTKTSPKMAKDFEIINQLHSKYFKIAKKLEPNLMTDIIGASEAIGLLVSATTGYYPTLIKFAGEKGARAIAQQLLINPRFQQLSSKMVDALNQNKFTIAKKLSDEISRVIRKTSPEMSDELDKISEEDFIKILRNHPKKKEK